MVAQCVSTAKAARSYQPGVHVPSVTWFGDDARQNIDWDVQTKHFDFLIKSGVTGGEIWLVLAGTNGEAATLKIDEKVALVRKLRERAGNDLPITVGCIGGCTRDVIDDVVAMQDAGADFALVLVPSYFHFALDQAAVISYFEEVADASPLPICIYNFPTVVAGLDVNSEMLAKLGRHPNIVAVKLTCGGIGKVARVAADFPRESFVALAGQSDWLIPCMSVGGGGCITGVGNLYPRTCMELFNLASNDKRVEAERLQLQLASAEWGFAKGGISGTKWVVAKQLGYPMASTACRRPYPLYNDSEKQAWIEDTVEPLAKIEAALAN